MTPYYALEAKTIVAFNANVGHDGCTFSNFSDLIVLISPVLRRALFSYCFLFLIFTASSRDSAPFVWRCVILWSLLSMLCINFFFKTMLLR